MWMLGCAKVPLWFRRGWGCGVFETSTCAYVCGKQGVCVLRYFGGVGGDAPNAPGYLISGVAKARERLLSLCG